jgi:stearoyl-CoA desaturase (delta-9 desaturase)
MPPAHTSVKTVSSSVTTTGSVVHESTVKLVNRVATDSEATTTTDSKTEEVPLIEQTFPTVIVWRNVALFAYLHLSSLYGAYLFFTGNVMWKTFLCGVIFYVMGGLGITAGCHRLWAHKSYKAKLPLRLLLALFQTIALQNSIHEWSRDHRVHHKYSETNADPHNAKRGFFFAHMGWLCCRKHPAVKEKGAGIDMSDLEADPIIMFQKKFYPPLAIFFAFIVPTAIPMIFWGESFNAAYFFVAQFRFCVTLHFTWFVNSAAHLWGSHPYDKTINPSENKFVAAVALGEGWHNYHHTFPWDYKTAELGHYQYNYTKLFLDTMAKIGWAYDLKTVPKAIVLQRVQRTGDGSHSSHHNHFEGGPWGWGDKDIPCEDAAVTETLYSLEEENLIEPAKER